MYFYSTKKLNTYFATTLLAVFFFAILPSHTLHDWFADHEDTEHGFCAKYHAHLGVHVETRHTHCSILQTDAPVYDHPFLQVNTQSLEILIAEISTSFQRTYSSNHCLFIPARGPPSLFK